MGLPDSPGGWTAAIESHAYVSGLFASNLPGNSESETELLCTRPFFQSGFAVPHIFTKHIDHFIDRTPHPTEVIAFFKDHTISPLELILAWRFRDKALQRLYSQEYDAMRKASTSSRHG